jgi:hypothetical protein
MDAIEDMEILVLDQTRCRVCRTIDQLRPLGQRDSDAELFLQSSPGGLRRGLARSRMTTAGIRPELSEVIFRVGTTLQQQFLIGVEHQDREGAVELTVTVDIDLASAAQLSVALVDQDDTFIGIPTRDTLKIIAAH